MILSEMYRKLGQNIKRCRMEAGLTQEALAEKAGISLDYLGKIEVNINQPGLRTVFKLAIALGISPQEFFK